MMSRSHIRAFACQPPALALGVLVIWLLLIGYAAAPTFAAYYPHADDWGLLAMSQPGLAQPLGWWTEGISRYFQLDGALNTSPYIRPLFNFGYWLTGLFADWNSPARLWLTAVTVATAAAAMALALAAIQPRPSVAFAGGLLLPVLPGFLPALVMLTPVAAFDPLCAGMAALAFAAYVRRYYFWAAVALFAALMAKESALPVALAFPLHYFWERRFAPVQERSAALMPGLALCLPLVIWFALRLAFSQNPVVGDSLLGSDPRQILARLPQFALKWPFGVGTPPWYLPPGLNAAFLLSCATLLANLAVVFGGAGLVLWRFWRERRVGLAELCFFGAYAYLLLLGFAQRYGAVISTFLLICLVHWSIRPETRRVGLALSLAALGGVLAVAVNATANWQRVLPPVIDNYRTSAEYVRVLQQFGADDTVLVLNDPSTCYSHPQALTRVAGITAQVHKLSDWVWNAPEGSAQCTVELLAGAEPGRYEFRQRCGLEHCHSFAARDQPATFVVPGIASAELIPEPDADGRALQWRRMQVTVLREGVSLVYYDPAARRFQVQRVP